MLFVVSAVLFDMLKARQLACVSKSGQKCPAAQSLSSRRAWIEISVGMKCWRPQMSLSSRRAWIEIATRNGRRTPVLSRSPHGERGLKYPSDRLWHVRRRRSPHGERGLKCPHEAVQRTRIRRSPHGERGLKSIREITHCHQIRSLSSRRAWIEIW